MTEKKKIILIILVIIVLMTPLVSNYVLSTKTLEITSTDNTMVYFANYHGGNIFREPYYTYEELPKTIILRNTNADGTSLLYFREILQGDNGTITEFIHGPFEVSYYDSIPKIISLFIYNVTITLK